VIVRILEDGQYELNETAAKELDALDDALAAALENNDEAAFHEALGIVVAAVHAKGTPIDPTAILPSDLALPAADSTLAEAHELLASEPTANN
jgi:hypothetical protein